MYKKKVSVVLINYNYSNFILNAIRSILRQKFDDYEILVADDCSTDDSEKIVKSIGLMNLKYIKTNQRSGIVKNLNNACQHAQGEYIAFLSADDEWANDEKLKIQYEFLTKNKDYVACYGYKNIINENGELIQQESQENIQYRELNIDDIIFYNYIPAATLMISHNYLKHINYFDENFAYEDFPLLLKTLSKGYKMAQLPYIFLNYRKHQNNYHFSLKFCLETLEILNFYSKNSKHSLFYLYYHYIKRWIWSLFKIILYKIR